VALSRDGSTALSGFRVWANNNIGVAVHIAIGESDWSSPVAVLSYTGGEKYPRFGRSVALSGDGTTAVVGAPGNPGYRGGAYVFTTSGSGIWSQVAVLTAVLPASGADGDQFGLSVAVSGDGMTAVVGAWGVANNTGAAYVFTTSGGGGWSLAATLTAAGGLIKGGFGSSLALSDDGTTLVVGAFKKIQHTDPPSKEWSEAHWATGAAYVFTTSGGSSWSHVATFTADDSSGSNFGWSVAISGDGTTIVVGARAVSSYTGAAYVFTTSGGRWTNQNGGVSSSTGACVFFTSEGVSWSMVAELTIADLKTYSRFGENVAVSGDGTTVVVDAYKGWPNMHAFAFNSVPSGRGSQVAELTMDDGIDTRSVALSGDGRKAMVGSERTSYFFSFGC